MNPDAVVPNSAPLVGPGTVRLAVFSPEQQYLLGWLACDGHFAKNLRSVRLQLQARDVGVLLMFCDLFNARMESAVRIINGYRYRKASVSSALFCRGLVATFGGRLKRDKQFPADATPEFVVGCMDADGAFCRSAKVRRIVVEFRHESAPFAAALRRWLAERGIESRTRPDRPGFHLELRSCRRLLELYKAVPFALARKRAKLEETLKFSPRWWTTEEVAELRAMGNAPVREIALRFGVTEKAAQLKRWKVLHGYNRTESVPAR